MSIAEKTCRTCAKVSTLEDGSDLFSLFNFSGYSTEIKMIMEEFEIWNLNIAPADGLPQQICLSCFDSLCQIHNFRLMCLEAQMNFAELCTGLDIIIKCDSDLEDEPADFPDDETIQTITVQEYYQFPGDERLKNNNVLQIPEHQTISGNDDPLDINSADKPDQSNLPLLKFKTYRCEYCLEVVSFDDPDQLNDHYNIFHSTDKPYSCPKCERCFNSKAKRNSHARVHYPTVSNCNICKKKVRGGEQLMAQHVEYNHKEIARDCPKCGKHFEKINLKRFDYHMSWHDESKLHQCKYCGKKFIQTTHLIAHLRTHTGESPYVCKLCGAAFKDSGNLYKHGEMHGPRKYECSKCPKKFFQKIGLVKHLQIHDPNRKKTANCKICDKNFASMLSLRLHNHRNHGAPANQAILNILKARQNKYPLIKPHKCSQCPESFVLHTQLLKHSKIHEELRPFTCGLCHKSFKRQNHLTLHENARHLNKRPHKCPECNMSFPMKYNLNEHISAKHHNKRNFKCKTCGKGFNTGPSLRTHMLIHTDVKPFLCKVCNTGFKQLSVLKAHMNNHLRKKEVSELGVFDVVV